MMHWLIIDVSCLGWRAFHTTGHLSHNDVKTGVLYGLLRDIIDLKQQFDADALVLCFDSKHSLRQEILPTYKSSRKKQREKEPEERKLARFEMIRQIVKLRKEYLPRIGFTNILFQRGYEADDMIASAVQSVGRKVGHRSTIVSADEDLFQLLNGNTHIWNPSKKRMYTLQGFIKEYGIHPTEWILVKAIAGCNTDDVPGIPGIGEKSVIDYLNGSLKIGSTRYEKIKTHKKKFLKKNKPLVELPFEGTHEFLLDCDNCSKEGWSTVLAELGIKSLRGLPLNSRGR